MRQSDLCVNSANEQVCTVLQCFLVSLEPTSALLNGVFPRIFTSQSDYTGEIIFERKSKAEELTSYCCCVASVVSDCATPETAAHQAPRSLGFSRQEHWSGLPFPSPMHESEK